MKKLILLSFILIVNFTFSQSERNKALTSNSFNFTAILEERNQSLNNKMIVNDFGEIVKVDFSLPTNNSEGKFKVYDTRKNTFLKTLNTSNSKAIFNTVTENDVTKNKLSFLAQNHHDFINAMVIKMKLNDAVIFNNNFSKENKNDLNKNLKSITKHKTLYTVSKIDNAAVDVIIGGLNFDFNKVYTSQLEHTVRHSLNLLVVNF